MSVNFFGGFFAFALLTLSQIAGASPQSYPDVSVYDIWFYSGKDTVDPPFIVVGYCAGMADMPVDIRLSVNHEMKFLRFFAQGEGCASTMVAVNEFKSLRHEGIYEFTAIVDALDLIVETDEDNNAVTRRLPVLELQ